MLLKNNQSDKQRYVFLFSLLGVPQVIRPGHSFACIASMSEKLEAEIKGTQKNENIRQIKNAGLEIT